MRIGRGRDMGKTMTESVEVQDNCRCRTIRTTTILQTAVSYGGGRYTKKCVVNVVKVGSNKEKIESILDI